MSGWGGSEGSLGRELLCRCVGIIVVYSDQVEMTHGAGPDVVTGQRLLDVLVVVNEGMDVVKGLSQCQILVFVVQFLFVRTGEALPAECIDE